MNHPDESKVLLPASAKPIATVGAGRLASMIWKDGNEQAGWRYHFNVFRIAHRGGRVSQMFVPPDVLQLVKLLQVLAAVIADDGCLAPADRSTLQRLATELDALWRRVQSSKSSGCASSGNPTSSPMKGCDDGQSCS
jgi:hypothetical protein